MIAFRCAPVRPWVGILALTGALTLVTGCDSGLGLVPTTGTVRLDGQPLADAEVVFRPTEGRPSLGKTDADGNFTLRYSADEMGALPGKHRVSISTRGDDATSDEGGPGKAERVPAHYNSNSTLETEVSSGQPPIVFELESGPDKSARR